MRVLTSITRPSMHTRADVTPCEPPGPESVQGGEVEIRVLFQQYLHAIQSVHSEPALSIRGFFLFFRDYLLWALSLYPAVAIGAINLVILAVGRPVPYVGTRITRRFLSPFVALRNGEIPALKLITARFLVRFFVFRHVRARLRHIAAYLEFAEFSRWATGSREEDARVRELKEASEIAGRLDGVLRSGSQIRIILVVVPIAATLNTAAKTIGLDLPRLLLGRIVGAADPDAASLAGVLTFRPEAVQWVGVVASLAAAILWAGAASFIRKREIMLAHSVYHLEDRIFRGSSLPRPRELPSDSLGYALGLLIYGAVAGWSLAGSEAASTASAIETFALWTLYGIPFVYAAYRRIALGRF